MLFLVIFCLLIIFFFWPRKPRTDLRGCGKIDSTVEEVKDRPQAQSSPEQPHSLGFSAKNTLVPIRDIVPYFKEGFSDRPWEVSLSFGKSSSTNFPQAVALAQLADKYFENKIEGHILHQAVFSSKPRSFLAFVKLYDLVSQWKSCFVLINGKHIDKKIINGINWCYGDKCRSGDPYFCYGARVFTNNPFGCHRLQVSASNHPWWKFGNMDIKGVWHVDKEMIKTRIKNYAENYSVCPSFDPFYVAEVLQRLPEEINPRVNSDWIYDRDCGDDGEIKMMVCPKWYKELFHYTLTIKLE